MSSNTLELVAKFKDNASQGLRRLLTEPALDTLNSAETK